MGKYTFESFVDHWWGEYTKESHPELVVNIFPEYGTVIVQNKKNGHFGMAKCKEEDTFSNRTGIAIAFAKYHGADPPNDKTGWQDYIRVSIERLEEIYRNKYGIEENE